MFDVTLSPKEFKRIVRKINFGKCWEWVGSKDYQGYGLLWYKGRTERIHRLMYAYFIEPVPKGVPNRRFYQIDHLCRNTSCCNPDHLEMVTQKVNVLRGEGITAKAARQTHCKKGHEFRTPASGRRYCPTCDKARRQ